MMLFRAMGIVGVIVGLAGCSPGPETGSAAAGRVDPGSLAGGARTGAVSGGEDAVTANGFPQATTQQSGFQQDPAGQDLAGSASGVVGVGHLPPF